MASFGGKISSFGQKVGSFARKMGSFWVRFLAISLCFQQHTGFVLLFLTSFLRPILLAWRVFGKWCSCGIILQAIWATSEAMRRSTSLIRSQPARLSYGKRFVKRVKAGRPLFLGVRPGCARLTNSLGRWPPSVSPGVSHQRRSAFLRLGAPWWQFWSDPRTR
jgi:hypothetical protein